MAADSSNVNILTDSVSEIRCSACGCEIDVSDLDAFMRVECPDCNNIDTVPARLGHFLLLSLLGTGGMGGVYHARDESLGRDVAIKVMLKSLGESSEFVETFKREAQAVAKLNHPNIAQIYSFGQEKGQPYIVMELISGQHLDKLIEQESELDQGFVMQVGLDIAQGLMAASEVGLIHGDIKPENILLDEKMTAKLVDFGIASFAHQSQTEGIWGTPYYIAPEKIQRKKADARSDMYSLGATLFHALARRPPFEGETPIDVVKARLNNPAPLLSTIRNNIDKRIETIIARMLEQNPARRHPTYNSLVSDFTKLVFDLGAKKQIPSAKRSGKVLIAKKRPSLSISSGAIEKALPDDVPDALSTRVRISKDDAISAAQVTSVSTSAAAPTMGRKIKSGTQGRKKKRSKAYLWILFIMLIAASITGVVVFVKFKQKLAINIRRETFAMTKNKDKSDTMYLSALLTVTNIVKITEATQAMVNDTTNFVFIVLGEILEIAPPEPAEETANAPSNTPALTATPQSTNSTVGEEAASPEMPAEQPDRMRTEPTDPTALSNAELQSEFQPELQPESDNVDEPPIKTYAKQVLASAKTAARIAKTAHEIELAAFQTHAMANKAYDDAYQAGHLNRIANDIKGASAQTQFLIAKNTEITNRIKEMHNQTENLKTINTDAIAVFKETETAFKEVTRIKDSVVAERNMKKLTEEQAEKERLAELERQRKEAALQNLIELEMQQIKDTRTAIEPMIMQHQYKETADSFKDLLSRFESDKGKKEISIMIERYTRLDELKRFVIKGLNDEPYEWGFLTRLGAQSIYGADETGLKLKDRVIPWSGVTTAQMFKIINHYLSKSTYRTRVLGEQNLSTAIFCYETGGNRAIPTAIRYVDKALEFCPDLENKAKKLLAPLYD
ncbi:MAG: protein kinase [Lentisphaerae bacterium]|nr:protein kinase [Lentisphaerota bacterium]